MSVLACWCELQRKEPLSLSINPTEQRVLLAPGFVSLCSRKTKCEKSDQPWSQCAAWRMWSLRLHRLKRERVLIQITYAGTDHMNKPGGPRDDPIGASACKGPDLRTVRRRRLWQHDTSSQRQFINTLIMWLWGLSHYCHVNKPE